MLIQFLGILLLVILILIIFSLANVGVHMPSGLLRSTQFVNINIISIFIVVILIFSILFMLNYYHINLDPSGKKKIEKVYQIEGFTNRNEFDELLQSNYEMKSPFADGFCNVYKHDPLALDKKCQEFSVKNCLSTSCCGVINKNKCVAGWAEGPAYLVDNYKLKIGNDPVSHYLNNYIWDHKDNKDSETN